MPREIQTVVEDFLTNLSVDRLVGNLLVQSAMHQFYAFTLVLVRMSGLMLVGPVFGTAAVPVNIRVFLVIVMSLLITPTLHNQTQTMFERIDRNGDGRLTQNEVPDSLRERFDRRLAALPRENAVDLSAAEFTATMRLPRTLANYAWTITGELGLGLVLGLGITIVLSGLQLAGQMIDQQAGLALAEVFNPGFETNTSVSGTFLFMFGVTVFLLMEPMGGHLMMLAALIETFQTIPIGDAFVSASAIELLRDLVHQSLVLAIQVAAPLLAGMSLIALAMGFLGHTVPQINVLIVGFPIRATTNLIILGLTLSGAARVVVDVVPKVFNHLSSVLA